MLSQAAISMSPQNCFVAAPARSLWRCHESPVFCPSYKATSNIHLASRKSLHSRLFSEVRSRSAGVRIECAATKEFGLPIPIFTYLEKWKFWNSGAPVYSIVESSSGSLAQAKSNPLAQALAWPAQTVPEIFRTYRPIQIQPRHLQEFLASPMV